MKKIILAVIMLFAVVGVVKACEPIQTQEYNGYAGHIKLVQKDSTWNILETGVWGDLVYHLDKFGDEGDARMKDSYGSNHFVFNGHNLTSGVTYELINYGGWSDVQCMGNDMADEEGYIHIAGSMPTELKTDEVGYGIKFWLVPLNRVNCVGKSMTSWTPAEFLFEETGLII